MQEVSCRIVTMRPHDESSVHSHPVTIICDDPDTVLDALLSHDSIRFTHDDGRVLSSRITRINGERHLVMIMKGAPK